MKSILKKMCLLGMCLQVSQTLAQTPGIIAVNNGWATFTNMDPTLEYQIEWSSSRTGAFSSAYQNLEYITPTGGNSDITVSLPMFIRVAATNPIKPGLYHADDSVFRIQAGTNKKFTVEWAETTNGPWQSSWTPPTDVTVTGAWMNVPTPRFYRVNFINCASNYHGCETWLDARSDPVLRTITFTSYSYNRPCMKIRVGQEVTFEGTFRNAILTPACQECDAMYQVTESGTPVTFIFLKPGYYNYYSLQSSDPDGSGMAGNIWVVP
jgi:plastocyanin